MNTDRQSHLQKMEESCLPVFLRKLFILHMIWEQHKNKSSATYFYNLFWIVTEGSRWAALETYYI